jgi:2,3,4,5-tetrahydropyridine-2-carboxylate N-succinyltransferase
LASRRHRFATQRSGQTALLARIARRLENSSSVSSDTGSSRIVPAVNVAAVTELQHRIEDLWDHRDSLEAGDGAAISVVREAIDSLDRGEARVAEICDGTVVVHEWLKKAILLFFQQADLIASEVGPFTYVDKIPLKSDFAARGVRVVPGASARWGSFQAPGVVLMPSYVNIGAFVDANTMVDTWATVGSCAQIGKNVHLSGGVGIGGVLEPPMAHPVIIEDDVLIGSRAMITNGARVGTGAVIGSGVILNDSIPVIDAETGQEVSRGVVPPWTVTVFATRARDFTGGTYGLPCALIIKKLNPGERHSKAAINEVLRTHGIAL